LTIQRKQTFLLLLIASGLAIGFGIPRAATLAKPGAVSFPSVNSDLINPTGASTVPTSAAERYRIDAGQSRFVVHVAVGGLLSAFGHDHNIAVRDFTGEANITPDSITPASLRINIKADSLAVTDKVSSSDREKIESTMRQEVLEVGKHPEIVFRSTSVDINKVGEGQYDASIWGELTLHGITKRIWLSARLTLSGGSLRAKGELPVRQSDYGIKPVSVAGGTVKVKNDLKLTFNILARKG
jgi:polyisoprenoid-binding protein YceI